MQHPHNHYHSAKGRPEFDGKFWLRLGERIPISINWLRWLKGTSFLTEADWDSPLELDITSPQFGESTTTAWFEGGEIGDYTVTVTVKTSIGAELISRIKVSVIP